MTGKFTRLMGLSQKALKQYPNCIGLGVVDEDIRNLNIRNDRNSLLSGRTIDRVASAALTTAV